MLLNQLGVFILRKLVILIFVADFIEGRVVELTEHQLEVNRHVRVVVERHNGAFFDKEEDQSVIFVPLDGHTVQPILEVITVGFRVLARDSQLLEVEAVHALDDALASRVLKRVIQKIARVSDSLRFETELPHLVYQGLHF